MVSGTGEAGTHRLGAKRDEPDRLRAVERVFRETALGLVRPAEHDGMETGERENLVEDQSMGV